jgi:translation initiation factor IF-2
LAKGIRISQLAKELGVPSKDILEKLRTEGLGEQAPNHQSSVSLGLAETIREWFASGALVTVAVAPEPQPESETGKKPAKSRPVRKKIVKGDTSTTSGSEVAQELPPVAAEAPGTVVTPTKASPAFEHAEATPPVVADAPTSAGLTSGPPTPAVEPPVKPVIKTVEPPPEIKTAAPKSAVETLRPAARFEPSTSAQPTTPAHPPAGAQSPMTGQPSTAGQPTAQRPTIKLSDRPAFRPQAATIQGPRVVRQEAPDVVPLPRPRRAPGITGGPPPAFVGVRPTGGRGVKVSEEDEEAERKKAAAKGGRTGGLSTRRRGPDGRRGEADEKLKEFTEQDLRDRSERLKNATGAVHSIKTHIRRSEQRPAVPALTTVQRGEPVAIQEPITVKSLAAAMGVKVNDVIGRLMGKGVYATVNQSLDSDTATLLAMDYGLELRIAAAKTLEDELIEEFDQREANAANLQPRPPVVTILGHVDHGKTSLLDRIRKSNVAAGEAGGITQHTAAWMVQLGQGDTAKRVTFIDTPGHQAFTAMRARGAHMTDIVVLVVSAAEGVQPQTIESINHARAAEVPLVVALNKIDRDDANPEMVLGQLAGQGLNPVEWGGDTEVVRTSATTGQGIENLIEILDLQSAVMELKADPTLPARGVVIEARVDPGLGPVATVLVQNGTLKVGDVVLAGNGYGRVRQLLNDLAKPIEQAGPSTPVIISGFNELPNAGDRMFALDDLERAREIAAERALKSRQQQLAQQNRVSADNLLDQMSQTDIKTINLIIKGDVQGSVETLVASVTGQNTEEVKVKVIHSGVGPITESDVQLAMATKAKPTDNRVSIIGFHVVPDEAARQLAEQNLVEIKLYRVIYEIFDDLKKALSGMLEPEIREKLHGNIEVRQVFKISRVGTVAGCFVTDGHVSRGSKIRLIRDGKIVTEDLTIESLKRVKDDVKEVKAGLECGIKLSGYDDLKTGDRLQAYVRETIERTL